MTLALGLSCTLTPKFADFFASVSNLLILTIMRSRKSKFVPVMATYILMVVVAFGLHVPFVMDLMSLWRW